MADAWINRRYQVCCFNPNAATESERAITDADNALHDTIWPFATGLSDDQKALHWYSSRKTKDDDPATRWQCIRLYVHADPTHVADIEQQMDGLALVDPGEQPKEEPNITAQRAAMLQQSCEIARDILNGGVPAPAGRWVDAAFKASILSAIKPHQDLWEKDALHFVANNLGCPQKKWKLPLEGVTDLVSLEMFGEFLSQVDIQTESVRWKLQRI